MSSASCFCTVLLSPLPLTAKGLARGQGYLQLILSYFGQMTNASIRLAFTSLSSEDWVPSYIQGIFDEQLLGSGAGLSNYCHELCCSRVTCAYPLLPFFFFFFLAVRSASRFDPSQDCRRLTQPCLRGSYKRTDITRGGLARRYWGVLNQLKAGLLVTVQPRPQRSGGFDMDTEALKKAGKRKPERLAR